MTKDGVSIRIDVTIVMRVMGDDDLATPGDDPNNVYKLVHEVTPFGLRALLRTALSIEARKLARSVNHADVLGLRNFAAVSEMTTATANTRGAKRVSFSSNVTGRGGMADALGEEDGSSGERDERDDDVPVPTMMDAMRAVLNQQFNELGIEILDVILRNIALPDRVQSRLTHKTLMICDDVIEGMQRRIDMQSIQHDEEIKLKRMHESDRTRLMKEGEYDAMLARLELDALRAEGERAIRSIESQMSIDVELVKAENALTVQRIEDEARLETERIRVQSNSDVEVELAATRNELDVISAKGYLEVARNIAKGEKGTFGRAAFCVLSFCLQMARSSLPHVYDAKLPIAIFKAEGKCAPLNRRLNDHLTSMNFLKAQSALASNGGVRSFDFCRFMYSLTKMLTQIPNMSIIQLAFVGKMGGGTANSVFLTDAALSTIPEKLEGLSHFIISEAIVESDPFTNTARRRNGTQSLPDARTLHRRRVHEIIAERKGRVFASR